MIPAASRLSQYLTKKREMTMKQLSAQTVSLLDDIEARIDPETEEDFGRQWEDFLYGRFHGDIFSPCRARVSDPTVVLPRVNITEMNVHWGILRHRGAIVLRDDSAMNLSPELYKEFAAPYDEELLKRFGGGVVHFCGRGDHYIEELCSIPYVTGVNMSQPHLNDMEKIYRNTVDKGLLAFNRARAEQDKARGFNGNLSC